MKNKELVEFGKLNLTGDVIYKKTSSKGEIYYANKDNSFRLMKKGKIFNTEITLSEVEVKKLLNGEIVLMELLTKDGSKKEERLVRISGVSEKGWATFNVTYPKKEQVN